MAIRGKTPRGSENRNHWNTDKLEPGKNFEGWIAGDGLCVTCHEAPITKPCLKRYLGYDVPCPGCASRLRIVDITYFPVYRGIHMNRTVVPLRTAPALAAEKFLLHHCVIVYRPTARKEGRYIESRPKQMPFPGGVEYEMPADISPWLPTLWKWSDRITGEQLLRGPVFEFTELTEAPKPTTTMTDAQILAEHKAKEEAYRKTKRGKSELETMTNLIQGSLKVVPVNGVERHDN